MLHLANEAGDRFHPFHFFLMISFDYQYSEGKNEGKDLRRKVKKAATFLFQGLGRGLDAKYFL
jgi:hypothetical protein